MQASEKKIIDFLAEDNELKLPIYQRKYEWKISNCKKLIEDILNNDSYFLGLLVTADNKVSKFLVDGQQRTTTFYITLVALRDIFLKINIDIKMLDRYLFLENNSFNPKPETERIKIKSLEKDYKDLQAIVSSEILLEDIRERNILRNYEFIYELLDNHFEEISNGDINEYKMEVGKFFEKIKLIEIVELRLFEGEDNPQQIFESLNSSGLKLNAAELIKNHILMELNYEDQDFIYNKYWEALEEKVNINSLSDFFRFYLIYKNKSYVNNSEVYHIFKNFYNYEKNISGVEFILDEILFFANVYSDLKNKHDVNPKVIEFLKILDRMGSTVFYVLYFHLSENRNKGSLEEDDFLSILKITESYLIRRYICELTNQATEMMFLEARIAIKEDFLNNYISFLKSKVNTANKFPDDTEFKRYFKRNKVFSQVSFPARFILYRIENFSRKEKINLDSIYVNRVFPEELNRTWHQELGENHTEVYDKYLNSICNLYISLEETPKSQLTSSFSTKKTNVLDDRLNINKSIRQFEFWNEKSISEHGEYLFNNAVQIWLDLE